MPPLACVETLLSCALESADAEDDKELRELREEVVKLRAAVERLQGGHV